LDQKIPKNKTTQAKTPRKNKQNKTTQSLPRNIKKSTKTKVEAEVAAHPLRINTLKPHAEAITGGSFSPDNHFFATVSLDRTLKIYNVAEISQKSPKFVHVNLPLDHATAMCFSADGHHIILALGDSKDVIAFRIREKKDEQGKLYKEVYRFPTGKQHFNSINTIAIASNNKFILTASEGDTVVSLWSLKGTLLHSLNTNQVKNNMTFLSNDARFFSVAAWTGDCRIWEIKYNKETAEFEKVTKAMELKGHKGGVYCVHINNESTRAITCSKDSTWKLWRLDVQYQFSEDPECILSVNVPAPLSSVAIAPNNKTLSMLSATSLFFTGLDGKVIEEVPNPAAGKLLAMKWSPDSKVVAVIGEASVGLYRNPM